MDGLTRKTQNPKLQIDVPESILPHRDPFLFVTKVLNLQPGRSCEAEYHIPSDLWVFRGHFPQEAIFPGVLILEMMAQTGAISVLADKDNLGKIPYLAGVEKARFRKPVRPGETIRAETHIDGFRRQIGRAHGIAYVNSEEVARAVILFWIGK